MLSSSTEQGVQRQYYLQNIPEVHLYVCTLTLFTTSAHFVQYMCEFACAWMCVIWCHQVQWRPRRLGVPNAIQDYNLARQNVSCMCPDASRLRASVKASV